MKFEPFRKIPRWSRDIVITEKIDGTNASIKVMRRSVEEHPLLGGSLDQPGFIHLPDGDTVIAVGSRNRWLSEETDNYGFWSWASKHQEELALLGEGHHFGEWWGSGIQRRYGMKEKHFSLFNVHKWGPPDGRFPKRFPLPPCVGVVPVLYVGPIGDEDFNPIEEALNDLFEYSRASLDAEGVEFENPEGIVIFHTGNGDLFKKTFEGDEKGKGS